MMAEAGPPARANHNGTGKAARHMSFFVKGGRAMSPVMSGQTLTLAAS
jgi:hypothetical protein